MSLARRVAVVIQIAEIVETAAEKYGSTYIWSHLCKAKLS